MNICMAVPAFPVPSEAFSERQARSLGATVCPMSINRDMPFPDGVRVNIFSGHEYRFGNRSILRKCGMLWNLIRHQNVEVMPIRIEKEFRAYLRDSRTDVVLAQYGLMGLFVMRPCIIEDIPFVVHFHGFDISNLYRHAVYRCSYRRLVSRASACVVVK